MRVKILYFMMAILLGVTGVSSAAAQERRSSTYRDESEVWKRLREQREAHAYTRRAYTERRWIGLRSKATGECPAAQDKDWEVQSLLDLARLKAGVEEEEPDRYAAGFRDWRARDLAFRQSERALLQSLELDRYCIYTYKPPADPVKAFQPPSGLVAADRDRLALSTTSTGGFPSDDVSSRIWRALAAQFADQTGQNPDLQLAKKAAQEPRVRLTFIDSQPDGDLSKPAEGNSLHGFTLIRFANDIACPTDGFCAAQIAARRALGYRKFNTKQAFPQKELPAKEGGHVGLVGELATAIVAEVLYWREHEPDKKLIINLSLGWDGEGFGDLDARSVSAFDAPVRAVYKALRFARRSGALVIAAAGNHRGGPQTSWPLLPAAWELRRPSWFPFPLGRKPVYAVGGVEWQGLPLPNSREGGRPRRAAYADHAVTHTGDPDEPTGIFTGTSVSAAVTSSIAAVVWHLRPDLCPAQVMRLVTRSGKELDSRADFYAWKPLSMLVKAPRVRLLSLCPAIVKACGADGKRCSALASFPDCFRESESPDFKQLLAQLPGQQCASIKPTAQLPSPELIDITSQRWVMPQPDATPCPGCTVVPREPPPLQVSTDGEDDNGGEGSTGGQDSANSTGSDDSAEDADSASTTPWTGYELVLQIGADWKKEALEDELELASGKLVITCGTGTSAVVHTEILPPETMALGDPSVGTTKIHNVEFDPGFLLEDCTTKISYVVRKPGEPDLSVLNPVKFGTTATTTANTASNH